MNNIVYYLDEVYSNRKKKILKCQQKLSSDLTVLLFRTDTKTLLEHIGTWVVSSTRSPTKPKTRKMTLLEFRPVRCVSFLFDSS